MDIFVSITTILSPLLASYAISSSTRFDDDWYRNLKRSPLEPPPQTFSIAWTIIYLILGIFLLVTLKSDIDSDTKLSYIFVLGIVLILTYIWTPIFNLLKSPEIALLIIFITLLLSILLLSIPNGWLIIPLIIWLSFATYLNGYIVVNN